MCAASSAFCPIRSSVISCSTASRMGRPVLCHQLSMSAPSDSGADFTRWMWCREMTGNFVLLRLAMDRCPIWSGGHQSVLPVFSQNIFSVVQHRALMQKGDRKPEPKTVGAKPPPRPPKRTAIGLASGDDDPGKPRRKSETVTIHLPPKPTASPTIKVAGMPPRNKP